jgi:hypothetical protein
MAGHGVRGGKAMIATLAVAADRRPRPADPPRPPRDAAAAAQPRPASRGPGPAAGPASTPPCPLPAASIRRKARLSRLVIAREVVDEVLGGGVVAEVSPVPLAAGQPVVTGSPGPGLRSAVGVLAVPPWRAGLEASVLPRAYRGLVEVAEDAGQPLRAAEFAAATGLSTDKAKVETLRSKLKRLVERGWLAEQAGPGCSPCLRAAATARGKRPEPG